MARVVVAMSGGVDSSVTAWLLKEQGHEVIGLFMRTGVEAPTPSTDENCSLETPNSDRKKGCCSASDARDARRIADQLDIPFYSVDFSGDFSSLMDLFADEYLRGRTPNPCVVCNSRLKFGTLWTQAKALEADFLATGHYVRRTDGPQGPELHVAHDLNKDQSYVLFGLKREILGGLMFPLGDLTKPEVREIAAKAGFSSVASKPDSVEICFVPDHDHARFVRERRQNSAVPGNIIDESGKKLGEHTGIERFTVGQRKGLQLAMGSPRYVLKVLPETHEVVIGERPGLFSRGLLASRLNWFVDLPEGNFACQARIRHRHTPAPSTARVRPDGNLEVRFDEPQSAVTPGQSVVLYLGTKVLGGAWIDEALPERYFSKMEETGMPTSSMENMPVHSQTPQQASEGPTGSFA